MIRVGFMSDVHCEFESPGPPARPTARWVALQQQRRSIQGHPDLGPILDHLRGAVDLMVLAGDIDIGPRAIDYADRVALFLGCRTIIVMGNHEGYRGRDLDLMIPEMRAAAAATQGRVLFLENDAVVLDMAGDRLHVLGCCLWTDYQILGTPQESMAKAATILADHSRITLRGRRFMPAHARELHDASRQWLASEVGRIRAAEGEAAKILIVTHHAPHMDGNPPQYRGGELAPAFSSDLTAEIAAWRPVAWIFGHTHAGTLRLDVAGIPVVCAQRGYVCDEPGAEEFLPATMEI